MFICVCMFKTVGILLLAFDCILTLKGDGIVVMQYDLYDATAIAGQAINETLTVRQPQYTSTLLPPSRTFLAPRQRVRTQVTKSVIPAVCISCSDIPISPCFVSFNQWYLFLSFLSAIRVEVVDFANFTIPFYEMLYFRKINPTEIYFLVWIKLRNYLYYFWLNTLLYF